MERPCPPWPEQLLPDVLCTAQGTELERSVRRSSTRFAGTCCQSLVGFFGCFVWGFVVGDFFFCILRQTKIVKRKEYLLATFLRTIK